ncbi:MAG: phosphonoacetaldehyde reductase [Alphaproteobacteria bacterium]|nr:phosphonoacetaldehyde reductase [Alphaproteobacteria bacterium]
MWRYANPVHLTFGRGAFDRMGEAVAGRRYCLVTYAEPALFAELTRRLERLAGAPVVTIDNVAANPDFLELAESCRRYAAARPAPELIVALGGGSVLDAAKVLAAADGDFARVRRCLETGESAQALRFRPIVAVPTTAGTGSEVTGWATVWDTEAKKKYSLAHDRLYPERAVVDPELTLRAPRGLTVSTGLDALSHALESIWNVNANPASTALAVAAARETLDCLPRLAERLDSAELREAMARAACLAGLAFSNTRTALAHSLSYHLTLHHGVPHGIACSFSLPMVMRAVIGCDPSCDAALSAIFGPDLRVGADRLERFLDALGVSTRAEDHGVDGKDWNGLIDRALAGERGRNFIGRRAALA